VVCLRESRSASSAADGTADDTAGCTDDDAGEGDDKGETGKERREEGADHGKGADDLGESGENLGEECSGLREELAELGGVKGVARQEASNKVDDELDNVLAQTGDELESIGDLLEEVVQGKRKSRELTLDGESATKLGQDLESAEERSKEGTKDREASDELLEGLEEVTEKVAGKDRELADTGGVEGSTCR
jgi:hypothetical protein